MGVAEASAAVAGEVAVVDSAVAAAVVSAVAGEDVAVASGGAEEVTAAVDVVDSEVKVQSLALVLRRPEMMDTFHSDIL